MQTSTYAHLTLFYSLKYLTNNWFANTGWLYHVFITQEVDVCILLSSCPYIYADAIQTTHNLEQWKIYQMIHKCHICMLKGDLFYLPDTKILRFSAIFGVRVVTESLILYHKMIRKCYMSFVIAGYWCKGTPRFMQRPKLWVSKVL